ncbi:hypothetical protein E2542_SST20559 [Spatholobus suberectus]|nr:hypothetical protein E2542_SST20559 [Spatholobus suberectus]
MAIFSNFSLMVVCFLISSAWMLKIGLSHDVPVPEPSNGPSAEIDDDDDVDAPAPLSSYEKYLMHCAMMLSEKCGEEIFPAIFYVLDSSTRTLNLDLAAPLMLLPEQIWA